MQNEATFLQQDVTSLRKIRCSNIPNQVTIKAVEAKAGKKHLQHALVHTYKEHEVAVKKQFIIWPRNLPNNHFSDLKQFSCGSRQ